MSVMIGAGCGIRQKLADRKPASDQKTMIGEINRGWLRYQIYLIPASDLIASNSQRTKQGRGSLQFSIRIINMETSTSPLRRLCTGLDDYNLFYEYLLNGAKNDLLLVSGTDVSYPVSYSFENNYNAFPFEIINVGYSSEVSGKKRRRSDAMTLLFVDKIFSHDTLFCRVGKSTSL